MFSSTAKVILLQQLYWERVNLIHGYFTWILFVFIKIYIFARCICLSRLSFLLILYQITTDLAAYNNTNLLSYGSGGWKSKMCLTGLKLVNRVMFLSGRSRSKFILLLFPASRSCSWLPLKLQCLVEFFSHGITCHQVVSDSLWLYELHHGRLSCSSLPTLKFVHDDVHWVGDAI